MSNLMNLTVVFLLFIFTVLLWHQFFRIPSEESMVLSAVSVILIVFFTGMLGNAFYSYYVIGGMAAAGVITFFLDISIYGKSEKSIGGRFGQFFTPSVAAIAILFLYTLIAFRGAVYTYPDELYQWGPAVRHMALTGRLPYGEGFSGQEVTLSTATMFQYLWVGLTEFVERNSFVGNFLLAFIPVFLPFSGKTWKDWRKVGFYTLLVFFGLNVMTYIKYYTLLQDFVLPMWAGGVLAWLLWSDRKKLNWGVLFGALLCIGSMKSMVGPLFSGVIILVVLIRQWIYYRPSKFREIFNIRNAVFTAMAAVSITGLSIVWSKLIQTNAYARFVSYDPVEKSFKGIVKGILSKAFTVYSSSIRTFPYMSFFITCAVVLLFLLILRNKFIRKEEKQLFTSSFALYVLGFPLFLGIMLFAYMKVFGANDAQEVWGLERYLAYYMLLGYVPVLSTLFMEERMEHSVWTKRIPVILLLIFVFGTGHDFIDRITPVNQKKDTYYKTRKKTREQADAITALAGEKGKMLVLGTVSTDIARALGYEMYDWQSLCYKSYARISETPATNYDVVRYPELLKQMDVDYLWCYQTDEENDKFSNVIYKYSLDNFKEGAFYKLEYSDTGVSARYLGNTIDESKADE